VQKDVGSFDISVDDARVVGGLQRSEQRDHQLQCFDDSQ
jgi:hypothetical protein